MKKVSKKKSSSPAATKADLKRLETVIKDKLEHVAMKSDLEKYALKTDLVAMESKLTTQMMQSQSELIRYMDLKHEQLVYDFRGIFADRTAQQNDRIDDHEHRLQRVEHKVGMAA